MKKNIHPKLHEVTFTCSCGHQIKTKSTLQEKEIRIEVCSQCHPFYTWEQRVMKTGAVDRFYARQKKAQEMQEKKK